MIEREPGFSEPRGSAALAVEVEPTTVPVAILEEVRETYLEILRRPERTLVTVIELLSPDNKVEPGFGQYLTKRNALLRSPVHLVELDFLARRPSAADGPAACRRATPTPWSRAATIGPIARSTPGRSADRFRRSGSRLLAPDPDIPLDLAAVYATALARGRYARSIDYGAPLSIGLAPEIEPGPRIGRRTAEG